jgi:serine/threonine protein kinase
VELPARIGRYDVERLLGEGGMGRVLLARDTVLGRLVALKILRDDLGLPPELKEQLVARMRQEARAAAALSHAGMVTLHDMGQDEQAGLYLVFELIEGPTLREHIRRSGPLSPATVASIARTLGSALTHAHEAGVIHRDVKPENVMLARSGAKLTDFGIARLQDSTLTRATTVLGTPAYSAPEALAQGTFSAMSDEFSLAATLYEALTGARAFPGDDALAVATRVATSKHESLGAKHPPLGRFAHLDAIFDRALAKDANNRFATCEMFGNLVANELEGANSDSLTPAPRSSIVPRATRRWQNVAALASVVVIATLVVIGRFHSEDDGVSLKSVASAYAAAVGQAPRAVVAAPPSVTHRVPPAVSASASPGLAFATGASASATPAPPPTPSASAAAGGSATAAAPLGDP